MHCSIHAPCAACAVQHTHLLGVGDHPLDVLLVAAGVVQCVGHVRCSVYGMCFVVASAVPRRAVRHACAGHATAQGPLAGCPPSGYGAAGAVRRMRLHFTQFRASTKLQRCTRLLCFATLPHLLATRIELVAMYTFTPSTPAWVPHSRIAEGYSAVAQYSGAVVRWQGGMAEQ